MAILVIVDTGKQQECEKKWELESSIKIKHDIQLTVEKNPF